jgi:cellobiose-specific phosphotransferase system component IIB
MDKGFWLLREAKELASRLRANLVREVEGTCAELERLLSAHDELGVEVPDREAALATIESLKQWLDELRSDGATPSRAVVQLEVPPGDGKEAKPPEPAQIGRESEHAGEEASSAPASPQDGETVAQTSGEPIEGKAPAEPGPAPVAELVQSEPQPEALDITPTREPPQVQAPTRKKPSITAQKYREMLTAWCKATQPLPDKQKADPSELLYWKSLACQGRVLIVFARELSEDESFVWREMEHVGHALKRVGGAGGEFFAFNRLRDYPLQHWKEVSRAFEGASAVARLATLLENGPDLFNGSERERIMTACRASFDWIKSRVYEIARVHDVSLNQLGQRLDRVERDLEASEAATRERTPQGQKRQVTYVIENVADWENTFEKRKRQQEAKLGLEEAIETNDPVKMVEALHNARKSGLAASDKVVVKTAERARACGASIQDEDILIYLDQRNSSDKRKQAPQMREVNPEIEKYKLALFPYTRGKRLFILSGKTKAEHAARLKEELELAEVQWPDVEKDTKVSSLKTHVNRCDLMLFNPNYSRHRYKELQDLAERSGKPCVVIDKGYGVDQIICRMYEELGKRGLLAGDSPWTAS